MNICIDTNIFFSFQKGICIGESPLEVINILTKVASTGQLSFYMPPRVSEEFIFMADQNIQEAISKFLSKINVQSPSIQTQQIGAQTLYDFVAESRLRSSQGLHVAEEILVQVARTCNTTNLPNRVDFEKSLQQPKEALRSRYRNATRTGFVDSLADLDLIFLAKETGSCLVSADEGVITWGRKLGVKEMGLEVFGQTIRQIVVE